MTLFELLMEFQKVEISITYNLGKVKSVLALQDQNITKPIFEAWGTIYRAAMQDRFNLFARGGGTWEPLQESTVKRRRKGRKGSKQASASILIDTGTLWATLDPSIGAEGQHQVIDSNSVTIGISGGMHPGGIELGELAAIHHFGTSRIPARPILVEPDERTRQTMVQAMEIGLQKGLE